MQEPGQRGRCSNKAAVWLTEETCFDCWHGQEIFVSSKPSPVFSRYEAPYHVKNGRSHTSTPAHAFMSCNFVQENGATYMNNTTQECQKAVKYTLKQWNSIVKNTCKYRKMSWRAVTKVHKPIAPSDAQWTRLYPELRPLLHNAAGRQATAVQVRILSVSWISLADFFGLGTGPSHIFLHRTKNN
jgi:hypothetical protein